MWTVVPAGEGWSGDPFAMRRQNGWILGRGVLDDKGPMVATLYTLKCLKELGVPLRYPIRALAGTNEETGMKDVEYYLAHNPAPVFCFTPDAEFPVCNGEKGHFHGKLVSPVCHGKILAFEGGVANNAVPDRASALVQADMAGLKNRPPNITLEPENGCVRVRGWGKSGHAASPEGTVNAIRAWWADYLLANGLCNEAERSYLEVLHKLHSSTAGEGLGIATSDGPFGPLTIIGGRNVYAGGPHGADHGQPLPHLHQRRRPCSRHPGPPSEPAPPWRTWTPPTPSISRRTPLPSGPASTPTTR